MQDIRAKKHLGQHFLNDETIAEKIASTIQSPEKCELILEIGPGMGVLTKFLLDKNPGKVSVVELDRESVPYLKERFPEITGKIHEMDFLKMDLEKFFPGKTMAVIGNFPYNISSQILFHILDYKDKVLSFSGMFQKEVAERIASGPGSKAYGILSVLTQAWYEPQYLFSVGPEKFNPPPKVQSGVIALRRKTNADLGCDEKLFKRVVKTAFNQRRKTLRNSLKSIPFQADFGQDPIFQKRPEQLSWEEFVNITNRVLKD